MENELNELINDIDLLVNLISTGEIFESEQCSLKAQKDAAKIKPLLIRQFYSIQSVSNQKIFIRNHYARLVSLNDVLFEAINKKESPEMDQDLSKAQKSVLLILDSLLVFILNNFSAYHDKGQKMPKNSQISFGKEMSKKVEKLRLKDDDLDHILYEKVRASIHQRINADGFGITCGLMSYLNEFVQEIDLIRDSNKEHSFSISLNDVLIAFNFNTLPVVHYLINVIIEDVNKIDSAKDKIERLNHWLKKINQVPIKPAYAFDSNHEAVHIFLGNWVQEEIRFYEKSLLLFSGFGYSTGIPGVTYTGYKIETELSVTQIACMVRLFTECGIIKNNNVRELLNFLAEHTRSKKRESISAESLRLKYYNIEESTRGEVRKIIFQFLKKINLTM